MGDGGVACMPLQHIMERLSIPEACCGGNNGNGFNSNSLKLGAAEPKKMKKVKKVIKKVVRKEVKKVLVAKEAVKKEELEKAELGKSAREIENGEICNDKIVKEEVEEGELGTLKWPKGEVENGELEPEKPRKSDTEKGEIVAEKSKKEELEKGEFVPAKWRKGDIEKDESVPERVRKGDGEKTDFGSWRGSKDELEKGEFIPDRWQRDVGRDGYSYSKMRRHELAKDKCWKFEYDHERERTPPSSKYSGEDVSQRKDYSRSGGQFAKRPSRWETGQERNARISSRIVDDEGTYKSDHNHSKNQGRECGTRLKRHGADSDSSERKHYGEYGDHMGSKIRKLSDDSNRNAHVEHYSRRSMERSYRNSSSSRISSSDRSSSRHYESSFSLKVSHDRHGRSPVHSERSPRDRGRYHDRDRSPPYRSSPRRDRSPYDRSRHYDHRNRSPAPIERSPDRPRYHDRRDRTPTYLERSPLDRNRSNNYRESNRKGEKRHGQYGNRVQDEKLNQRDACGRDPHCPAKESQDRSALHNGNGHGLDEKNAYHQPHKEEKSQSPCVILEEPPQITVVPEELASMEEDMDICDTPPHVPLVADSTTGKWFYLDHFGMERGPSKLCDLKKLMEEGVLVSDHLIKHVDSDRWLTIENATSPLVPVNFPSIVSDTVTQLVSPPEAPGNLLAEAGDVTESSKLLVEEAQAALLQSMSCNNDSSTVIEPLEDLHIDERVETLLKGFTVIPGRELETLGEALQVTFEHAQWEKWGAEGLSWHRPRIGEQFVQRTDEYSRYPDITLKEASESRSSTSSDKDYAFAFGDSNDWFSARWASKGGDWKRNDESALDRLSRKKLVLNDGYPLCLMPKSGYEDPRWHQKDELYCPSQSRKLDLPVWAFSWPDDRSDCNNASRASQIKPVVRGVKGSMLPVVRINACVSEPLTKVRGKERYSSRSTRQHSSTTDVKRSSVESASHSKSVSENDSQGSWKCITAISTPKDRLCTAEDLQLHLGDWYYLDGTGHEQGPSSFSELQGLVDQGLLQKQSSVFRKNDKIWVPITSAADIPDAAVKIQQQNNNVTSTDCSGPSIGQSLAGEIGGDNTISRSFHSVHPQFIGYTCGKLHELVMKSYKSREFAAAINEVLDSWINSKQPKKEITNLAVSNSSFHDSNKYRTSGIRGRWLGDGSEDDYELEDDVLIVQKDESTFEDLFSDATFYQGDIAHAEMGLENWGLLDGNVLARVFHFLRTDVKSLAFASLTCKHWRAAVTFSKGISRQIDLSSVGPQCTDTTIMNMMNGYDKERITSMILTGCTNITPGMLEDILSSFHSLSSIDIRGCSQFWELAEKFSDLNWIKGRIRGMKFFEESYSKAKALKQITERPSVSKPLKSMGGQFDDSSELKEYFDSVDRRESANQSFRRSYYKRSKLFDARRSSSILSRDARMRRWSIKKSENAYKRMEEFLASSLRDIMKENTYDFFVPKVAEIEDRMKSGYYGGRGLSSVKEDISRMCRDAIKSKSRGDSGNMNRVISLFIRLATCLEEGSKSSNGREDIVRWKDESALGFWPSGSKYKKKLSKIVIEKKCRGNGGSDYGEYASDREIRRRLSKLNKKSMDSGSDTSDDLDRSSEGGSNGSVSTASDTESDLDFRSESGAAESRVDGYVTADEGLYSMTDDREWGARMTKASLVPPVTRKYEVIEQYVIVADEEEVQRKMKVSLPEDYNEKLSAQKNGTEESDMEIPEVKDYKPRKQLGDEVIEQEVYGIDPYTHNLLLDSMPEELDWPLLDKHLFIEDVLLCTLNKQVRHFTGTGNTPMMYPLQPVVEEIQKRAEEEHDIRFLKMCQGILKAMNSRPDDNYVAYRKGLGVVCNKEGGFGEEDFVVEFLGEVYPAWKWFEKQDGIRSLQKNSKDPAPEFYNIYLERPKGDADGYDLVVVDAMHKANYASRICHSCRPNCEAKVTAVEGQYQIGIYAVRPIQFGEEITFDYNSVTESKEEYEASVCLCGSQVCRGSYLNLTGEGAFQKVAQVKKDKNSVDLVLKVVKGLPRVSTKFKKISSVKSLCGAIKKEKEVLPDQHLQNVLKECHGILDRCQLMFEACERNMVSEEDYMVLGRAGLGSCLLGGLPDWLIAYAARLVKFINFERTKLPEEILRHNLDEKRKYFAEISIEVEKSDAEVQAEGVYNQRLQNLALTLDKVRYVMRCVFGDPKKAPPPLERLSAEELVSLLWKGEGSLVEELVQCMAPHMEDSTLSDLKPKIRAHDPSGSDDIQKELQKSLLWLRDEVRNLPCNYKCRHDAAADLIHIYAYTKCFFRVREYKSVTSSPVYISPLDLGPKYSDKLGSGIQEYHKTYGENYCLGQLIYWHNQTNPEPDSNLARASRGCLSLPDIGSFYAKVQKPSRQRVYGPRTLRFMLARMEKQPQRPWPKDRIWSFKGSPRIFGSPMLDAVLEEAPLDREMLNWLKNRPATFQAMWDR